jgi:hypothetical protein
MLLEELTCSRREVALLRHAPTEKHRLLAARGALLRAMESYAAALTERGMPTPWKLRADPAPTPQDRHLTQLLRAPAVVAAALRADERRRR